MRQKFIDKVHDAIRRYKLIVPGELVIVGVSGGPDSLALLHVLNLLRNELKFNLHVAHLDHSFRGKQAQEEAVWVKEVAESWGLPCSLARRDVPVLAKSKGLSPQDAGHMARKEFFLNILKEQGAQKIALGHHADDQAETLLIHFLTGTGPEGLRGILPANGPWIRPLLFVRRREIEAYCHEQGLNFREDPSNKKNIYLRNRIRNELLPWLLDNVNPGLVDTLNRTARIFWAEEEYFQARTEQAAENCTGKTEDSVKIMLKRLLALPLALQRRVIRLVYKRLGHAQGLPFLHVEEVLELAAGKQVGKALHLPGGVVVEKSYDTLLFYPAGGSRPGGFIETRELIIPGRTDIPETGQTVEVKVSSSPPEGITGTAAFLPFNGALPLLFARSRREGDRFCPHGLNGTKKLKDYFIDKKIPRAQRDRVLLICDENEVLWIPGLAAGCRLNKKGNYDQYLVLKVF